ncbi:MAG: DUF3443 family protein [Spongiibacteraceae bacterium]
MKIVLASLLSLTLSLCLTACGGGGGGGGDSTQVFTSTTTTTTTGENTHPITVNGGPLGIPNLAFTSVTVCVPNTSQCQTIDNVIVDTGSVGLRLVPSALGSLNLPAQTAANGNALFNCVEFVDLSHAWGPVRRADVKLSNYTASNIPIQVVGDVGSNSEPTSCGGGNSADNLSTVASMGGNGIIGIGYFREDCGVYCTYISSNEYYFSCNNGCIQSVAAANIQLQNPIALFPSNNNGVILDLPSVPSNGSLSVTGSIIFGIGTQSNNSLNGKTVFTTSSNGLITTQYKGTNYTYSFIDSGSNGLFFADSSIPSCTISTGFYCPASTLSLSGTIIGQNNSTMSIPFSVANTESLNGNFNAFNNLAGYLSGTFDWGLPFFYGRKVYTGFETDPQGPFTAF